MPETLIATCLIVCMCVLRCVQLFATPWTVAHQAPPPMGFLRHEYWSELPFPTPGNLPDPRIEPTSPVSPELADGFFTSLPPEKPIVQKNKQKNKETK